MAYTILWTAKDDYPSAETTKVITLPAGLQDGDWVMFVAGSTRNNNLYRVTGNVSGPWQNIGNTQSNNPAGSVFVGRMVGEPDVSITVDTGDDLGLPHVYLMIAVRGAGSIDRSATFEHALNSNVNPFAPAYTTEKANTLVFAISIINDVDAEAAGVTAPDGYSNLVVEGVATASVMLATKEVAAAGTDVPYAEFLIAGGLTERCYGMHFALAEVYEAPDQTLGVFHPLLARVGLTGADIETATHAIIAYHGAGGNALAMRELVLSALTPDQLAYTTIVTPESVYGRWWPKGAEEQVDADDPDYLLALEMATLVAYAVRAEGVPLSSITLVGFSQGAVLVLDHAGTYARGRVPYNAVLAFSGYLNGCLVGVDHPIPPEERYTSDIAGLDVYMDANEKDFQVSLRHGLATRDFLLSIGVKVSSNVEPGALHGTTAMAPVLIQRAISTEKPEYQAEILYGLPSPVFVHPRRQERTRYFRLNETWHFRGQAQRVDDTPMPLVAGDVELKIGDYFTKTCFVEDTMLGRWSTFITPAEQQSVNIQPGRYPMEWRVVFETGEVTSQFAGFVSIEASLFAS